MKLIQSAVFALIFAIVPCRASGMDKSDEGIGLLKRAAELSDMHDAAPYQTQASVQLLATHSKEPVKGTMLLFRQSATQWRREFHLTGFESIEVVTGDRVWRLRSLPFTPMQVRMIMDHLPIKLSDAQNASVKKVTDRKLNGVPVRCVELKPEKEHGEGTWCVYADSGFPAVHYVGQHRNEYSEYESFAGRYVPKRTKFFRKNILLADLHIEKLSAGLPDAVALFSRPIGSTERPWCEHMQYPHALSAPPESVFPRELHGRHLVTETTYELTIGADGRVEHISSLTKSGDFDPATILDALKNWKFKPAMCGDTTVPSEIQIEFWFSGN